MAPPRTFDHDEARRLHAAGLTVPAIAVELGITQTAVSYAVDPVRRAKCHASSRAVVKARRAQGLHYDYIECVCGEMHDRRYSRCWSCRSRDEQVIAGERAATREERLEVRERLTAHIRALREQGYSWRQITRFTGVQRTTAIRWFSELPTRPHERWLPKTQAELADARRPTHPTAVRLNRYARRRRERPVN